MSTAELRAGFGAFRSRELGRVGRVLVSPPLIAVAIVALTWPTASIVPTLGPDPSWTAGLYLAHAEALQFGRDIVFTYGPLGFLGLPVLYDPDLWIGAYLFRIATQLALALSLIQVGRRAFPLPLAALAAYVVLVVGDLDAALVLVAFLWCFVAVSGVDGPPSFWIAIGGGVAGSLELLVKLNFGVAILAMVAIALLARSERRRSLLVFLVAALVGFACAWLLSGQNFTSVPLYLARGAEIVSGYSDAMGADIVSSDWQLPAALVVAALLLGAVVVATARGPGSTLWAPTALVVVFLFMAWKQGFVRQGIGSAPEFFALALGVAIAVSSMLRRALGPRVAIALTAAVAALAVWSSPSPTLTQVFKPGLHLESMGQGVRTLLSPGERRALAAEGREWMRSSYRIDSEMLARIGGRSVHIDPWEVGVAWAFDLDWQPLPTMQSYVAYSPELDRLNAAALEAPDAPEIILRHRSGSVIGESGSIDTRYPGWESPAAMRAMLCHYRDALTTGRWQLLERVRNRCGSPELLLTRRGRTGSPIHLPVAVGPNRLLFARIDGLGVGGLEAVRSLLYRARERTVELAGRREAWNLVAATAGDGLLLSVSPGFDFRSPFQIAPNAEEMTVRIAGSERELRISVYAQEIRSVRPPRYEPVELSLNPRPFRSDG